MARKSTKKQPEAPQVNVGAEIFAALRDLEKVRASLLNIWSSG